MSPTTGDKWAEARDLADDLLGTCAALPDHVMDDPELCKYLDDLVMLCTGCEWWVEIHDLDGSGRCGDCQEQ